MLPFLKVKISAAKFLFLLPVCVCVHACTYMHMEVKEQIIGAGTLFPPIGNLIYATKFGFPAPTKSFEVPITLVYI